MKAPETTTVARKDLRQHILRERDALSAEKRRQKSAVITTTILQRKEFLSAKTIFLYVNFRSEVETLALIRQTLERGKTVCVPFTDQKNARLFPFQITDPEKDLRPGYCGIPEPDPEKLTPVAPQDIDAVLLPGSVFDRQGGRLGYGGGFYDRFLADQAPTAQRIGLAFELQVVDRLPLLPHDQPLHCLATEKTFLHF